MLIKETDKKYLCKCDYCGKEFSDYKSNRQGRVPKYCSPECYHTNSRFTEQTRKCLNCGKEIKITAKRKNKKFCNVKCSGEYRSKTCEHKVWEGCTGYRYVCQGNKSISEHVLIMEKHIGRKLSKDEVVHHKDFNRNNNDINNLQLMTRSEHSKLHREYEKQLYGKTKGMTPGWNKGLNGKIPHNAKKVIRLEDGKQWASSGECAKEIGGRASSISRACKGERKTYKGYHFKYIEDI